MNNNYFEVVFQVFFSQMIVCTQGKGIVVLRLNIEEYLKNCLFVSFLGNLLHWIGRTAELRR